MQFLGFFETVRDLSVHQQAQSPFPLLSSAVSAAMKTWMSSLWQSGYHSKWGVGCPVVILVFSAAWSDFRLGCTSEPWWFKWDLASHKGTRDFHLLKRITWGTVTFKCTLWDTFGTAHVIPGLALRAVCQQSLQYCGRGISARLLGNLEYQELKGLKNMHCSSTEQWMSSPHLSVDRSVEGKWKRLMQLIVLYVSTSKKEDTWWKLAFLQ